MSIRTAGKNPSLRSCLVVALVGLAGLPAAGAEMHSPPPQAGKGFEAHSGEGRPDRAGRHSLKAVQSFFENLGKGDLPAMMAGFAADAKWVLHAPAGTVIPFAGSHEGRSAVQAFIETFGSNARPSVFETREFIVDGNKVVVLGYEEATAIPTGKAWKAHWTMTFTVQKGKIAHVDEAVDTEAISAAFRP